ncbi:MAG TPA: ResB protein required for cytochrome C biosynthesis [Opitutae bacterium]|nr:ResB protein required for cytochrome C biosynthesis [Opitutaceae bacterium]HCR31470.1 ResB protein required for cytochrome C biosynthesis [Opitutae bacterium]|tara:strand:+ start:546 stop:1700 length:1155 start_codon:yes stop_codon:yes gene_type:complete
MKPFIRFFSSFELAISCMALGLVLVFIGTIAQVQLGIHGATELYFYSYFLYWKIPGIGVSIPYFPGGYTLGFLLLINLVTALFVRFRYSWKKSGVLLVHIGVITLLIGELISSMMQVDSAMIIDEGGKSNFSEDRRLHELAIVDHSRSQETDRVYAFPHEMLENKQDARHEELPFTVSISRYMANAEIRRRDENAPSDALIVNQGIGLQTYAIPLPKTGKMDAVNRTTAVLTVFDNANGEVVGTWLSSLGFPQQKFEFQGKEYSMEIRRKRYNYPFEIKLLDFSHDRYLGTNIPMNFSSEIELTHPERGENREFLIYMNHPLRYNGLTFFQSGFANEDTTTILQVVSNPGRHLPYISCILIFIGLTVQFGIGLISFTQKRLKKP